MAELSGVRKSAILLLSLSEEQASEILKRLPPEAVEEVSREIAGIREIPVETRQEIFGEFYNLALANSYLSEGGLDYAKALIRKSLSSADADRIIKQVTQQVQTTPFSFLQKAESENLLTFIQDEHPQTIALILAHLNASQAGDLISSLPEALRADVVMRMANLQEISPEVVRRISLILEQKLEALGSFATEAYGGVRAVAELFNRMDRTTGRVVLEKIENENPQLAASIRDLMFVFDDILLIDDLGIAEILKRVDKKSLTTALKGTSEELRSQFFRNMSSRAVELMKEEMEFMGPVKLKDVEKTQHEIVEIVRQLVEEGVISIGGGGGDDYVC